MIIGVNEVIYKKLKIVVKNFHKKLKIVVIKLKTQRHQSNLHDGNLGVSWVKTFNKQAGDKAVAETCYVQNKLRSRSKKTREEGLKLIVFTKFLKKLCIGRQWKRICTIDPKKHVLPTFLNPALIEVLFDKEIQFSKRQYGSLEKCTMGYSKRTQYLCNLNFYLKNNRTTPLESEKKENTKICKIVQLKESKNEVKNTQIGKQFKN
eukprot:TRINITY_DN19305_c0_g1_i1.p2 TRINITY_DN19305_c0_g1~~TRINITY_DN19305_c0_g1_i1.p2  ORF type:complete len:206 (+),score=4.32 TRINITY_DN19305_c0_g1_i1:170-787(+)